MKRLLLSLILMTGCVTVPQPGPKPEPTPAPSPVPPPVPTPPPPAPTPPPVAVQPPYAKNVIGEGRNPKLWKAEWNDFVAGALDDYGPDLMAGVNAKADIQTLCQDYFTLTEAQKKAVWALFVASVAYPESGYDPASAYMESFGVFSDGLLQVSYSDYPRHPKCELRRQPGTTEAQNLGNAFDPKVNIRCGVAIMNTQVRTDKGLFQNGKSYYWSTLNKALKGYPKVMQLWNRYRSQLAFCGKQLPMAPMYVAQYEDWNAQKKAFHSGDFPEARKP